MVPRLVLNVFIFVFLHAVFIIILILFISNVHVEVIRHHILVVRLLLLSRLSRELDFLNSVQIIL